MVREVPVNILQAFVPVEDSMATFEGPQSGNAELDNILEMPKNIW